MSHVTINHDIYSWFLQKSDKSQCCIEKFKFKFASWSLSLQVTKDQYVKNKQKIYTYAILALQVALISLIP